MKDFWSLVTLPAGSSLQGPVHSRWPMDVEALTTRTYVVHTHPWSSSVGQSPGTYIRAQDGTCGSLPSLLGTIPAGAQLIQSTDSC